MAKRYAQAVFRATHNSYSGAHRGDRGTNFPFADWYDDYSRDSGAVE